VIFTAEQLGLRPGLMLKSRDLIVDVKKKHLKVALKGKPPLIYGELHKEVLYHILSPLHTMVLLHKFFLILCCGRSRLVMP
jgi:hypothetical protein